jgi:hypothetical protein
MALTFGQIAAIARESAHSPAKVQQSYDLLNAILSDLCQERDFAEARGQYLFDFVPNQNFLGGSSSGSGDTWGSMVWGLDTWGGGVSSTPNVWPGAQFGSGPYPMPVDYLRLSGSSGSHGAQRSFIWWLNGVPYPVIPVDLAEFDMQVQQTGLNAYVWLGATDMSAPIDDRILVQTTGDVVAGSTTVANLANITRLIDGNVLGVGGQGIQPGTTLATIEGTGPVIGTGSGSPIGTGSGSSIGTGGISNPGKGTLSRPATATIFGASLIFGYAPVIFVYPPPISQLQAMIRYQRQMPQIIDPSRYPWIHNDRYLIKALIGRLCELNDDSRAAVLNGGPNTPGSAESELTNYLSMKDDEQSHPKTASLDRRVFGRQSRLPATKQVPAWW